ncbi:hypothetical protein EVAR_22767_1 [Eumeta japonica]|uniref:Uncharacterized protein n=1 Tax=Eumeta variegata TaxID=151549 RepID=A0A4C1UUA7_EUMVA|nr:hypothetical protein EVAR_22767_1 [Eumeta japonica]
MCPDEHIDPFLPKIVTALVTTAARIKQKARHAKYFQENKSLSKHNYLNELKQLSLSKSSTTSALPEHESSSRRQTRRDSYVNEPL